MERRREEERERGQEGKKEIGRNEEQMLWKALACSETHSQ